MGTFLIGVVALFASGGIKSAFVEGPDQVAIELLQDATPQPAPVTDN